MGKVIFRGNSTQFYHPNNFDQFMKTMPWTYLSARSENPVEKKWSYLMGDNLLIYEARKRIVPRDMNLWSVKITVHGPEKYIQNIETLILDAAEPKD